MDIQLLQFQIQLARYRFDKYVLEVAITTLEQGGVASRPDWIKKIWYSGSAIPR